MTDENMFCFQCEQTAGCTACTGAAGVCGKTADVARLQDDLTGTLVALARAESGGRGDTESDGLMLEGMFACVSNVSFDPKAIAALERRVRAKAISLGEFSSYDMGLLWDLLATAVIALAGIALRVLVGEHATHGLHDGRASEVLRSDELDTRALTSQLSAKNVGDLGIAFTYILQRHITRPFQSPKKVCAHSSTMSRRNCYKLVRGSLRWSREK